MVGKIFVCTRYISVLGHFNCCGNKEEIFVYKPVIFFQPAFSKTAKINIIVSEFRTQRNTISAVLVWHNRVLVPMVTDLSTLVTRKDKSVVSSNVTSTNKAPSHHPRLSRQGLTDRNAICSRRTQPLVLTAFAKHSLSSLFTSSIIQTAPRHMYSKVSSASLSPTSYEPLHSNMVIKFNPFEIIFSSISTSLWEQLMCSFNKISTKALFSK